MHHKKKHQQHDLIYGPHAIKEMLKAKKRRLVAIYTTKPLPKAWNRIQNYLPKRIPNTQYVSRDILTKMAGTTDHGGLVALVSPFKYTASMFNAKQKPFILLLDGIQDVGNLGAILRTAYCTGVDGVVLCKKGGSPINSTVFKTSAGLAEHLDIYQAASISAAVTQIKKAGYTMYMATLNGKDATSVEYASPKCLVIGNEAIGITKEVLKHGEAITLPQRTSDISYNASVATGILLFLVSQAGK